MKNSEARAFFTDFDGTLVRITRRPADARLSPKMRNLLASLAKSLDIVGVVSGRTLADLQARVGVKGIAYVGSHGFSVLMPDGRRVELLPQRQRARIRRIQRIVSRQLSGRPGISLEPKDGTVAIHFRGASRASRAQAREILRRIVGRNSGFMVLPGKKVWELMPSGRPDKFAAIDAVFRWARRHQRAQQWFAIYVGDDTTDECVFENWKGISVAVGKRRRTAARYFLRSPAEVRRLLERLEALG